MNKKKVYKIDVDKTIADINRNFTQYLFNYDMDKNKDDLMKKINSLIKLIKIKHCE